MICVCRKNARVPLPPPPGLPPLGAKQSNDSNDSFADSTDLSSFLLQRMQEGVENVTLDGPVITGKGFFYSVVYVTYKSTYLKAFFTVKVTIFYFFL